MGFRGENFLHVLLACTAYCAPSLQTIAQKTIIDTHKTAKFVKVFSLESFPLYGTRRVCTPKHRIGLTVVQSK